MSQTFSKKEKLKSRKLIATLFEEGKTASKFPIKVFYLPLDGAQNTMATFAVPKRTFKSAVTRNRIKRQLREAYRLQKEGLITNNGKNFALLFLYISKDNPQQPALSSSMLALLKKITP